MKDSDKLQVSFTVKNTGQVSGSEVVQLYVKDVDSTIFRPDKELKAFDKIFLDVDESRVVTLILNKRSFAYYNVHMKDWHVESGEFDILVGASSRDIRLNAKVKVESTVAFDETVNIPDAELSIYYDIQKDWTISKAEFEKLYGSTIIEPKKDQKGDFNINSTLEDIKHTFIGKLLFKALNKNIAKMAANADEKTMNMIKAIVAEMPLRNFGMMSQGAIPPKRIHGLIYMLNGKVIKGLIKIIGKEKTLKTS